MLGEPLQDLPRIGKKLTTLDQLFVSGLWLAYNAQWVALLPIVLIFMLLLVNKKELMGEYVNSRLYNVVAWGLTIVMIVLSAPFVWDTVRQMLR